MKTSEDEFLKELLAMFRIEAEEHIKALSSGLLELEKLPVAEEQEGIVETIYREVHSMKGAARAVNLHDVESICQMLESVFSRLKNEELNLSAEMFDTLHRVVDSISHLIQSPNTINVSEITNNLEQLENREVTDNKNKVDSRTQEQQRCNLQPVAKLESVINPKSARNDKSIFSDTVRISTMKLDSLLLQTEELLAAKLSSEQQILEFHGIASRFNQWKKEFEKYGPDLKVVESSFQDQKVNTPEGHMKQVYQRVAGFLLLCQNQLKWFESKLIGMSSLAEERSRMLSSMVDNLMMDMKQVLMLPFSTLLKIVPKTVRDMSRDQGKKVELITRGSTIEVDRRILEEMRDPIIHLLRNCIDHGIEKPEERMEHDKSESGTIRVIINQLSDNKIEILVSDDGAGIDPGEVKKAAIKKGVLSKVEAQNLSEKEILGLVFLSDVSTSPIITDLSGRGLGLAIVREKVEKLGGMISLETRPEQGTTFRLVLPVTLSTFRGILIRVSGQAFIVPTSHVERVTRVKPNDIKTVRNRETISLNGHVVSLIQMADVLEIHRIADTGKKSSYIQILVLKSSDRTIAFCVDEVLNEQEILVKTLGKQLTRVRNVSGATILGSGEVVAILNVSDLVKSALKFSVSSIKRSKSQKQVEEKKSILVAEDSITSRILLKNILESAGYNVKTTINGLEALTELRSNSFDLIVSDIEMPGVNGFDLVSKVRSDNRTSELPVVLVTAIESRGDRERGIDVGANAYIVKRDFNQSNLLDVVQKLI
jgi:two-component system chemotaxis sensor kinase CheA